MANNLGLTAIVFFLTLAATYAAAFLARRHSIDDRDGGLAGRRLNRWLIGLSAGTTANSGFIVTAAVGLGYAYGVQWVLLPLSWMLGDLVFWYLFPARLNAFGRQSNATTLSEVLTDGLTGRLAVVVGVACALTIIICLAGYTAAQWLAGQKFLAGAFALPDYAALSFFAIMIIGYSAIGGFRGSVYVDTLQAFIRIIGTALALAGVIWFASTTPDVFTKNIAAAGNDFLNPFPGGTLATTIGFVLGFAAAAVGFGLGQPQIVSRYFAGSSPEETRAAWPIYITFVQLTWIAMTVFGILLRGVMPGLPDPEAGLSVFFQQNMNAIATGVIVADVFATIASTSNGILIAMAQAVTHDVVPRLLGKREVKLPFGYVTLGMGLVTMVVSVLVHGTVLTLALSSVSMMAAGLAGAVMIKIMHWRHTAASLLCGMLAGILAASLWKYIGWGGLFNEGGVGIAAALATNWIGVHVTTATASSDPAATGVGK